MTTSLAVLVKLPSILIGLPMLYLGLIRHGSDLFRRRDVWILTTVAVVGVAVMFRMFRRKLQA